MKLPIITMVSQARTLSLKYYSDLDKITSGLMGMISCRPGCSGCCHRKINVTLGEALLIYDYLNKMNKWNELKPAFIEHVREYEFLDEDSWRLSRITCPLLNLGTGECSVNHIKPMFCAVHFSIGEPSLCDPWYMGPGKNGEFDRTDVYNEFRKESLEKLVPVYLNISGSLSDMVLKAENMILNQDLSFEDFMRVMS